MPNGKRTSHRAKTVNSMISASLLLFLSQATMLACSILSNILLARGLGPQKYGQYSVVTAILFTAETLAYSGIVLFIQKCLAQNRSFARSIAGTLLKYQVSYSFFLCMGWHFLVPPMVRFFHDEGLIVPLRAVSFDIILCSLYNFYNNSLNGLGQFGKQALNIISYSLAKFLMILIALWLGWGLLGALMGHLAGSTLGILVGRKLLSFSENHTQQKAITGREILISALPITLLSTMLYLLTRLDLIIIRSQIKNLTEIGIYALASTIASSIYLLMNGISAPLLSLSSNAIQTDKIQLVQEYIRQYLRIFMLAITPIIIVLFLTGPQFIGWIFSTKYEAAANLINILVFDMGFLSLFMAIAILLYGCNASIQPLLIGTGMIVIEMIFCPLFIRIWGAQGAALLATLTALLGSIGVTYLLFQRYVFSLNFLTIARCLIATVLSIPIFAVFRGNTHYLVVFGSMLFLFFYFAWLFLLKELSFYKWKLYLKSICYGRKMFFPDDAL